jgi:hypothetical protein
LHASRCLFRGFDLILRWITTILTRFRFRWCIVLYRREENEYGECNPLNKYNYLV